MSEQLTFLNMNMVKNSLIHHDDILVEPIKFIGPSIKWPIIADRLKQAFLVPNLKFAKAVQAKGLLEKKARKKNGMNRRWKM